MLKKQEDFFLEEAAMDDWASDLELIEVPLTEAAFWLVGFLAGAIIIIAAAKLLFLNIGKGNFYRERALLNAAQVSTLPASRGLIYDRFGKILLKNKATYKTEIKLVEILKDDRREEVVGILNKILGIDRGSLDNLIDMADIEKQDSITLPIDLSEEQIKKLSQLNAKAVQVKKDYKREYPDADLADIFFPVLGYIGYADKEGVEISLNDFVGKSGLEKVYDERLRGKSGKKVFYRNARGEILEDKFLTEPQSGLNLETTIDRDLQIIFYRSLRKKMAEIGSPNGVGIVLNPQNGEVLALVDVVNSRQSFFNRAISGLYSPGSTIKPLVAFAGLKENFIEPKTQIFSRGYIEVPNPYFPDEPSRFLDWKPNGWVDMRSALAKSSNIYFYALAGGLPKSEAGIIKADSSNDQKNLFSGLGIEKLKSYWQMFGLADKTGIDLSDEASGFLPDPSVKADRGGAWHLGDTYNSAIGQGDLLITPVELINYIAGVANYGKFLEPHIAKTSPKILRDLSSSENENYFNEVERGMIDAVEKPYGTAHLLSNLPMKIAAKTGSAQIQFNTKVNAFFVGYAPVPNPQLAILVLIENAKEGSLNAAPVAKEVLRWYYENRIVKHGI